MYKHMVKVQNTNKIKDKTKRQGESKDNSVAFVRTSKILFVSNKINQGKHIELSNFPDLCSDALSFLYCVFCEIPSIR